MPICSCIFSNVWGEEKEGGRVGGKERGRGEILIHVSPLVYVAEPWPPSPSLPPSLTYFQPFRGHEALEPLPVE